MGNMYRTFSFALLLFCSALHAQDVALVPFGSTWKYRDNGSNQGTPWRAIGFNDSAWASGPAELGYGDGDESTLVGYGPNASAKYITTYFRKTLNLPDVTAYAGYLLSVKRDDGFVVYLNGTEVMRQNLNQGTITYTTLAYQAIADSEEPKLMRQVLTPAQFVNGDNTIAVEMHQSAGSSSDLSFNLELLGLDASPSLFRGPYLQASTPTSIVVKWKTDVPTDSRVRYGSAVGALDLSTDLAAQVLEHEVKLTGLQPNTTYFYAIGTTTEDLAGDAPTYFFRTHPPGGSVSPVRIWAIGDAGTAYINQARVRDAYTNFIASSRKADVWLMLGDNAYNHGRECEYQQGVFQSMYEGILRNTPLFPCIGNHDYYSGANGNTNTGTYYTLFAPPKLGEGGGVPSNTEAYYSYDYGNVHFISLDSYGVSRSVTGAMATWLTNDIAQAQANRQWIIVYWHHPPYTKGSHDSDDSGDSGGIMFDMRQNIVPIIESHGVDLVLCGHSHSYERSFLINGHYGVSSTFNGATMKLNGTPGQPDGAGAYTKPGTVTPNMGTVYAVCGVSGKKDATGTFNHPAMYFSSGAYWGSMVIDVLGNTLSGKFLNDQGQVIDHFDIRKAFGPVKVELKAFLEGPFDPIEGRMRDDLRLAGMIPTISPYPSVFPHLGEAPAGAIAPALLTDTGANAIVDWVFVELRDRFVPSQIVAAKAALIQRDGDVVDVDGTSPVQFALPPENYHVALRHRNHLGVMTGQALALAAVHPLRSTSPPQPHPCSAPKPARISMACRSFGRGTWCMTRC
ncbi:MAG: metallophosphoesterase family protein [Flavobacteriales bacterium]|nr:metallophosphoesterase family protein [Flavobacteriales bacterium]